MDHAEEDDSQGCVGDAMTTSAASATTTPANASAPRLKLVLSLSHLLVYGMIIMQVAAPVPIFGLLEKRSDGHAVTTVLIAMVAMMITAISYGRMAILYPMAGSAYTYVARSINPHLGFLTGWSMFLDYLIIPLISAIIPALAIQRLLPWVPFPALTLLIVTGMTVLNLYGIRATVRANAILLVISSAVVILFLILAARYIFLTMGWDGLVSPHRGNPSRNIILVGALAFLGTIFVPFDNACDLLNFGAYVGFMGVNLATLISYFIRPPQGHRRHFLWDAALSACGFLLCLVFWLGLPNLAKLAGSGWLLLGLGYCAVKTGGFRRRPLLFDFAEN
jgi:amino acid transporter